MVTLYESAAATPFMVQEPLLPAADQTYTTLQMDPIFSAQPLYSVPTFMRSDTPVSIDAANGQEQSAQGYGYNYYNNFYGTGNLIEPTPLNYNGYGYVNANLGHADKPLRSDSPLFQPGQKEHVVANGGENFRFNPEAPTFVPGRNTHLVTSVLEAKSFQYGDGAFAANGTGRGHGKKFTKKNFNKKGGIPERASPELRDQLDANMSAVSKGQAYDSGNYLHGSSKMKRGGRKNKGGHKFNVHANFTPFANNGFPTAGYYGGGPVYQEASYPRGYGNIAPFAASGGFYEY